MCYVKSASWVRPSVGPMKARYLTFESDKGRDRCLPLGEKIGAGREWCVGSLISRPLEPRAGCSGTVAPVARRKPRVSPRGPAIPSARELGKIGFVPQIFFDVVEK